LIEGIFAQKVYTNDPLIPESHAGKVTPSHRESFHQVCEQ